MDGLRKIASAYYDKAALEERKKVIELFDKLDSNGDGRISLEEYKKRVSRWFSDDSIFRQLDADGDGKLDFLDVVVLYYMEKNKSIIMPKCDVCGDLLAGLFFTCVSCYRNGNDTFDLCSDCYAAQGKFQHPHPLSDFADQNDLLRSIRQPQREMEELSDIAQAHYQAAPKKVRALADKFFASMDADGDGHIDSNEFLSFMRDQGYPNMRNPDFFKVLDRDGNGTLEFSEVLTLYYIVKSGRPFCDMCDKFIPGVFFSCVDCYNRSRESSIYLCRDCYRSGKCEHNHNGRAQFLDNYTLLEVKRDLAQLVKRRSANLTAKESWMIALKALEVGMNIGSVAGTLCSIL